jgi:2-C-methyl-D-erythritol 4-phosphate cytidylyltransferase
MTSAILVAAGKGVRMGMDKLWAQVAGQPVAAHSWLAFDQCACIDEVLVVIRQERREQFMQLAKMMELKKPYQLILGGAERQDSVWNGLQAISPRSNCVAIHDAARPCVTEALIEATVHAAREFGAAVAAQKVTDTIKESSDGAFITQHLDRSRLWSVQTPQCFRVEVIRRALEAVRRAGKLLTDDTAACEEIGQPVRLVESPNPNPKVTVPDDLAWVEVVLRRPQGGQ